MKDFEIKCSDNYILHGSVCEPDSFEYIIYIIHGMCEHKERYYDFMSFLASKGYCSLICDLRGHGYNESKSNLGYFGSKDALINDTAEVINYIKHNYKDKKIIVFAHSMGTLVARNYIQNNDKNISKLILCGPPTKNNLVLEGSLISKVIRLIKGDHYRSKLIQGISIGSYNKGFDRKNDWISRNADVVEKYNSDEYCGFTFTTDGFEALFYMLNNAYKKKYKVMNKNMPILLIAGSEDKVIGSKKKFIHLERYLKELGYTDVESEIFDGMRHELISDLNKDEVNEKVLTFIEKK